MAVKVNKFKVRHNGVVYGPGQPGGQIIEGLSKEEEAKLTSNSNGTIVLAEGKPAIENSAGDKQSKKSSGDSSQGNKSPKGQPNVQEEELPPNTSIEDLIKPPQTGEGSAKAAL
jgi:hypothetical protein